MTDLAVRIGTLTLKGPVLAASGTYGYGDEFAHALRRSRRSAASSPRR